MLVVEDALVGILMALLPIIAGHRVEKSHSLAHVPSATFHSMLHGMHGPFEGKCFHSARPMHELNSMQV